MPELPTPLEADVHIAAPPEQIWSIVSDVKRMGEWSPECRRMVVWGTKGVRKGGWVTGINRRSLMVWPTNSKIHLYDEGRAIGWTVLENRACWSYHLEPEGAGTRLTERREMPRGRSPLGAAFAKVFLGGGAAHDAELLEGMRTTLARIKAAAESAPRP